MNIKKLIKCCKVIVSDMDDYESTGRRVLVRLKLVDDYIMSLLKKFIVIDKNEIDSDILDLIESIIVHVKTIYDEGKYTVPYDDELYDKVLSRFKKFRDEPFANNTIGLATKSYKYETLSGTLDKVHFIYESERDELETRDSLEEWIMDLPESNEMKVLVNQKKDGTSVTVDYKLKNGIYVAESAISRGKKDYGEGTDVSPVAEGLTFEPKALNNLKISLPKNIGIQYELVISEKQKKKFEDYLGKEPFANCRSAAVGLLRRIVFAKKKERAILRTFMSLVPVGFESSDDIEITWDSMYMAVCKTFIYGDVSMDMVSFQGPKKDILKDFSKFANMQIENRSNLDHDIDGLVMTILNKKIQKELGRKSGINKYQIAYKFPEQVKKTRVLSLLVSTGNFGYKGLLAEVEPVNLNGTIQFKGQIHSLDIFDEMDLRVGDEVYLKLSGDVIPYMYKDSTCKPGKGDRLELPKYCECGHELVASKNMLRCPNEKCPYRIIGGLVTFFTALNAKGIGDETCKALYNELGITKPSEVLSLKKKDFLKLDGFKDASSKLCVDTINDIITRPRKVSVILSALGIDSFRASTAQKVLDNFDIKKVIKVAEAGDFDNLVSLLKTVKGIDKNANIIADGLICKVDELKNLLDIMTIKETKKNNSSKIILVSGIRNDDELDEVAQNNGYEVKDSGKKFDLLVIKDYSYLNKTKGKLALKNQIPVMSRDEFMKKYK